MFTTLGPLLGTAYVPGRGAAHVFANPDSTTHLTVQIDRTGQRLHMRRSMIQWRKPAQNERKAA